MAAGRTVAGGEVVSATKDAARNAGAGRYKPYPAYKDSGVEWLGEIPAHWEVKRLRSTLTSCQNGVWGDEPDGLRDVVCVRVADFDRVGFRVDIAEPTLRSIDPRVVAARGLRPGDLLLEKSGGGENQPVGAVVLYDHTTPAVCSNFVARVTIAERHDPRFLTYMHVALYALRVNTRHIKQSTGIQNLDSASYLSESTGLPSEPEQRTIAAFLDRETARIDALVAKKERLIALLQEQRTALITRAVTKGLPSTGSGQATPTVPMKDSGVEWLGEIPAHWEVKKWRYCCHVTEGQVAPDDERFRDRILIAPNHIESGTGRILYTETADEQGAISGKYLVAPGDIIYSKIRPSLNKVCIADGHWLCSADMYPVAITEKRLKARFLQYFMLSEPFVRLMVDESMRVAMPKVNREKLSACPLVIPHPGEQEAIAAFLDRETARIDALVAKVREAIERLRELRTALISAAVTGKIDVREEVE
jgi:type I restriction enzyme S subunit